MPLAVAAGVLLASSLECLRGDVHLERLVLRLLNASYAIGPALVLGLAGESPPSLGQWPLYVAALAAQFALDFAVTAARQWITLGVPPRNHLRAMTSVYVIDAGLAPIGLAVAFAAQSSPYGVLLALPLIGLLSIFARERRVRIDHELELRDAYRGTAFLLGDVVEADDAYTGVHSRDVVELALRVADGLELGARERRDLEFAALLHDVGKVRVPNEIINKPGPLTDEERKVMERHTVEGERLLLRVGGLLGEIGARRALLPRALGRRGLSRRPRRRADPAAGSDRLLLRRLQRDDERPLVPQGAPGRGRRRRSCGRAAARSSTRASSTRCSPRSSRRCRRSSSRPRRRARSPGRGRRSSSG